MIRDWCIFKDNILTFKFVNKRGGTCNKVNEYLSMTLSRAYINAIVKTVTDWSGARCRGRWTNINNQFENDALH